MSWKDGTKIRYIGPEPKFHQHANHTSTYGDVYTVAGDHTSIPCAELNPYTVICFPDDEVEIVKEVAPEVNEVPVNGYAIKDSGERASFKSGMVRDVTTGKIQWHRVFDGPMLKRWAEHLTKGAAKYPDVEPGRANWTLADGIEEYLRFKESALRHFIQWYMGETDEDHGAAVFFNINGAEYVKDRNRMKANG